MQGEPLIWTRYRGRVFLFQSETNYRAWQMNPVAITNLAETNRKRLGRDLPVTLEY